MTLTPDEEKIVRMLRYRVEDRQRYERRRREANEGGMTRLAAEWQLMAQRKQREIDLILDVARALMGDVRVSLIVDAVIDI